MRSATRKKEGKNPVYLEWLHTLPCAVFSVDRLFSKCYGRVTAHHAGARGLSQRSPDWEAIPLCCGHHQDGPHSVHRLGKKFWQFHGIEKDVLISALNRAFEER